MNLRSALERVNALLETIYEETDEIDREAIEMINAFVSEAIETWPCLGEEKP